MRKRTGYAAKAAVVDHLSFRSGHGVRQLFRAALLSCVVVLSAALPALAQADGAMCANPGQDPSSSATGTVNSYWRGNGNLATGATTLTLGTYGGGAGSALGTNDLLLIIQMQDGSIDSSNSSLYGDGTGIAMAMHVSRTGDPGAAI